MTSNQQTDAIQLAIDTTGPDMEVACEDGWVVHPRLGDAVGQ